MDHLWNISNSTQHNFPEKCNLRDISNIMRYGLLTEREVNMVGYRPGCDFMDRDCLLDIIAASLLGARVTGNPERSTR